MSSIAQRLIFVGYCWGAAATTWLARALNSHPDVLAFHALDFPRFERVDRAAAIEILEFMAASRRPGVYAVSGVTHGVQIDWHESIAKAIGERLRGFVLTRHPITRIESHRKLHERMLAGGRNERAAKRVRAAAETLARVGGGHLPDDAESLCFYHSCSAVNRIAREVASGLPIIRSETLFEGPDGLNDLLAYVSDGRCRFDDASIRQLQVTVVGSRTGRRRSAGDIYDSWVDELREAYDLLVSPETRKQYSELGYDLPASV